MPTGVSDIAIDFDVRIPMRDGITLSATLYRGRSQTTPAPCVVTLTPYVADSYHERASRFARAGFAFLAVDCRGRGNSEGEFTPFVHEADDGHDVVIWAAAQPWCYGKVAMQGNSYGGYVQWRTASRLPPPLVAIMPGAAPYPGIDFPMRSNIFSPFVVQWLQLTAGRTLQAQRGDDQAAWSGAFRDWHASGRAFRDVEAYVGRCPGVFRQWLDHPMPDAYWDALNPKPAEYAAIAVPVLTITGTYDDDQPGALAHYRRRRDADASGHGPAHYLLIGPWDHSGVSNPQRNVGGVELGPAAVADLLALQIGWCRWVMGKGEKPGFLAKPVTYYVMGSERWRNADTLEAVTACHRPLFLASNGRANDLFDSGYLQPERGTGPPDSYRYDPAEPPGPEVEAEERADATSLIDQSVTIALGARQLVYHSAAFEADTELSGFFRLSAWLAIDCPDTDFYVSVHEVCGDGCLIRLTSDAMRARYREGPRSPRLIETREPLLYVFDQFTFVSRLVRRRHRLRLVIASVGRMIAAPFTERNFNAGGVIADETRDDALAVTVRLFHDQDHQSMLELPIGAADGDEPASFPTNNIQHRS